MLPGQETGVDQGREHSAALEAEQVLGCHLR